MTDMFAAFWLIVNVLSSVGLVFLNKALFSLYRFRFGIFLTSLHFVFTFAGLYIAVLRKTLVPRKVPIRDLIDLAVSLAGSVVLLNLSLLYNSVSFYQLTKISQTPAVALAEIFLTGKSFTKTTLFSLILICVGVAQATVSDVRTTMPGFLLAIGSIGFTVAYHVLVKAKTKKLQASSNQLLYSFSPLSSLLLAVFVPVMERDIFIFNFSLPSSSLIALSGFLAYFVNVSGAQVISRTSALTFSVCGHLKTVLVLSIGLAYFDTEWTAGVVSGVMLAVVGIFMYSFRTLPKESAAASSKKD
mmetsp:Transcript_10499/g.17174  ORF Transcript_10499/g.17174 Transcript_10499/m.17174 type:complete len:301 (-) Transcript_10499:222-1124(-)